MRRFRALVNVLMGLTFLVQGLAVAATPVSLAVAGETPAQSEEATMDHCAKAAADAERAASRSCCDEDCPNMAMCLLAHVAVAAPVRSDFPPTHAPRAATLAAAPLRASPQSLLRPPIDLHG